MKILHITSHLTGGAALAVIRLHSSLLHNNMDSRVLTLDVVNDKNNIYTFKPIINYQCNTIFSRIVKSLLYRFNWGIGRYWRMNDKARKEHECQYTYPVSPYRVENHSLIGWADIIHLHLCDDFINYPSFFKKVKKPIVWTLHDIGIGYGGFHYKVDYDTLLPYFQELEEKFVSIKSDAISPLDSLTIISLSKEMYDYTKGISYLKDKPNYIIPNSVDTEQFVALDKLECRKQLSLPQNKTILLFVSEYVETKSKGLELLKEVIASLDLQNILLCIVGNYPADMPIKDSIKTLYFGKINDSYKMSQLYSAADYLIAPSSQEVCCQTPLESMACETPVVVFPSGAMKDYVHEEQGVVCKDCSKQSLKEGLLHALQTKYDSASIRKYVSSKFSPSKIAQMYIEVYKSSLNK